MSTYTQILYQIVFGTKYRRHVLCKENRDELFKYITGIIENKKCHLYIINGVEDHVHIVLSLHPSVALADLVKDIKVASSQYINQFSLFPGFLGWVVGYGAFTYSIKEKRKLIEYVENQEAHHSKVSFQDELSDLLRKNDVPFDDKYLP